MSLIEKIDAEILCIKKVLVSGTFTEEVYGTLMGKLQMVERIKEIILAEQKEPCEYCVDDVYYDILGTPCKYNNCPMCGRPLNQSPGEPKPLTKGDKIRESNESLARCIEALVAIALGDSSFIDVERRIEWLNQPQEGE